VTASWQTIFISRSESGRTIGEVLRASLGLTWAQARQLIGSGRVQLGKLPCRDPAARVRSGQRLVIRREVPATRPAAQPVIRFADEHVVVVDKPAGLTTMRHPEEEAEFGARGRRFLPATLADLLPALLATSGSRSLPRLRAVHRLDKDTSGLVVFARTAAAESYLGKQFRNHSVERCYLALVRGRAVDQRIESYLVRDRGDGRRGSSSRPGHGKRAVTHVRVVEELGEFALVQCVLETGRTHQVRIHLGERGIPLCGERVYDRPLHGGPMVKDTSGFSRPALHAATLGFLHPVTGKRVSWHSRLPSDMAELISRLRAGRSKNQGKSKRPET
jgi:23S rRNA pseudouridine1911/1915/1917 synthase